MRENRQDRTTNVTPAFILGDGVSALGIVRSLGRRGIPVYLFSSERDGIAEQSRYAKTTMLSEPKSHRAIANDLLSAAKGFDQKPVLYYLTDDYLDFVSDNREQLQERFLFPISSRESIECVGKKEKFGLFCAENAVPAPQNFTMDNDAEVMQLLNDAPTL